MTYDITILLLASHIKHGIQTTQGELPLKDKVTFSVCGVSMLLGAMVLSWARSSDHYSGEHFWVMLRSSFADALHLARDVFIYILIFSVVIGALHGFSAAVGHMAGAKAAVPNPRWINLSAW